MLMRAESLLCHTIVLKDADICYASRLLVRGEKRFAFLVVVCLALAFARV